MPTNLHWHTPEYAPRPNEPPDLSPSHQQQKYTVTPTNAAKPGNRQARPHGPSEKSPSGQKNRPLKIRERERSGLDGRHADAAQFAQKSLDIQPGYTGAWVALANALGHLGRTEEARQAMASALRVNPAMTPEHLFEQIRIAAGGDADHAEKTLAGLKAAGLF